MVVRNQFNVGQPAVSALSDAKSTSVSDLGKWFQECSLASVKCYSLGQIPVS